MLNAEVMERYRDGDIYRHNTKEKIIISGSDSLSISYKNRLRSYSEDIAVRLEKPYLFKGKREEESIRFLINGDNYSPTTNGHINMAIHDLKGNIQIPFSTLYQALLGTPVEYEDIKILDMTGDEYKKRREVIGKWISVEDEKKLQKSISTTLHLDGCFDLKKKIEEMGFSSKLPYNWGCEMSENGMEIEIIYEEHHLGSVLFKVREGDRKFRYFLSSRSPYSELKRGFDGYFLVELPYAVTFIPFAYQVLVPLEVQKMAREERRLYKRQGEYFFVEATDGELKEFRKSAKVREKTFSSFDYQTAKTTEEIVGRTSIYKHRNIVDYFLPPYFSPNGYELRGSLVRGNPHTARDLMVSKRSKKFPKKILVRGTIRHPEHKTLNLGEKWHWVYINRAKESWSVSGRVD